MNILSDIDGDRPRSPLCRLLVNLLCIQLLFGIGITPVTAGGVSSRRVSDKNNGDPVNTEPAENKSTGYTATSAHLSDKIKKCKHLTQRELLTIQLHPQLTRGAGSAVEVMIGIVGTLLLVYIFVELLKGTGKLFGADQ